MPRGNQLIRQWQILRTIEASRLGLTAVELHEEVADLGSPRTVYRDLEVLQAAGFPLYQEQQGRWRILDPSEGGTLLPVQPTEVMALLLSEQMMEPLTGSELGEPLRRLRSKLSAMLGPRGREYVEQLRGRFCATISAPGTYRHRRDDLQLVEQGVNDHRKIRIRHFAAHRGETLDRTVAPYGVWFTDGALYLIAFDELREDIRKFLVDRIRSVELLEEPFDPDPDFDLQAYVGRGFRVWHGAVHQVEVEFSPSLAHLPTERRFHRTQKVRPMPDGSARVTFDAAGLPDLASWVCSFGGQVRAIRPAELVEMVREMHREGLRVHEVIVEVSGTNNPKP